MRLRSKPWWRDCENLGHVMPTHLCGDCRCLYCRFEDRYVECEEHALPLWVHRFIWDVQDLKGWLNSKAKDIFE